MIDIINILNFLSPYNSRVFISKIIWAFNIKIFRIKLKTFNQLKLEEKYMRIVF